MSDQRQRTATEVDTALAGTPEPPKPDAARRAPILDAVDPRDAGGLP